MAVIKPFCAVRAKRDKVALVSSRSYEAYSPAELGAQLDFNPFSFLHIISPSYKYNEDISPEQRFEVIRDNYLNFKSLSYFSKDEKPAYYIYKKVTEEYTCTGIIAAASSEDYKNKVIKPHEDTLKKREVLFEKYLRHVGFNAEPVLLTYPDNEFLGQLFEQYESRRAEYEFTTENHVTHYLWVVNDTERISQIEREFARMERIYIADGHHRTASSSLLTEHSKARNPHHNGTEAYNYFMSYLIPQSSLIISEFNRLIKDLNGMSKATFLEALSKWFIIEFKGDQLYHPSQKHDFSMYLDNGFYKLSLRNKKQNLQNPVANLDTQILYNTVLKPLLGIKNVRKDRRLQYANSKQGAVYLKQQVDSGQFKVAFGLYPVSIEDLKTIADAALTMPPKSTYIRPKLRSGLTIYEF
ncbi:DUF1015 domain-containing protein [Flavobacteriaceae bacterium F08102]|nr:DUF1015 domain-containing protein [Flavobacteriaceae bacterium F08102]